MNHEKTHVAGRRAEPASCSQYKNARGLPKPLKTQYTLKKNCFRFSSAPRKKNETLADLNPVLQRKPCIGERTACVGSLTHI